MSSNWQLHQAITALHSGRTRLMEHDIDLSLEIAEELPEEVAAVETAIVAVCRAAMAAEDLERAARERASATMDRAKRFGNRADQLRGVAFAAMDALGKRKIEAGDLTVSVRNGGQGTIVTDETKIPDEYWKTERKLDRAALSADLKIGVVVEGAEIGNGPPSLMIKGS